MSDRIEEKSETHPTQTLQVKYRVLSGSATRERINPAVASLFALPVALEERFLPIIPKMSARIEAISAMMLPSIEMLITPRTSEATAKPSPGIG